MWKIILFVFLSFSSLAYIVTGDEGVLKLGDECDFGSDCENISNAICNSDDECECAVGYVASQNKTTCLKMATKAGDDCEIQEQCSSITFAKCVDHSCVIPTAVTNTPQTTKANDITTEELCIAGLCKADIPAVVATPNISLDFLGKPCSNDSQCQMEGLACTDKLCQCKEGFVASQNLKMCLPKAKSLGDKCNETSQCVALNGSICENQKCSSVISKFSKSFDAAMPPLLSNIGSTCQNNNDCQNIANAICKENVCQCTDNYISSVLSNSCLEKARKEGDPCEIDKQCEDVKGTTCNKKKCVKPANAHTRLGNQNSASARRISLAAVIFFIKMCFV